MTGFVRAWALLLAAGCGAPPEGARMRLDQFWGLVRDSRSVVDPATKSGNAARQAQRLAELLRARAVEDVEAFDRRGSLGKRTTSRASIRSFGRPSGRSEA